MPSNVDATIKFTRDLLRLSRKFPTVVDDVEQLVKALENDQRPGDRVPGTGFVVFKTRLANKSAGKGKSGGFRVIYFVEVMDRVFLLTIYAKVQQADIPLATLRQLIAELLDNG